MPEPELQKFVVNWKNSGIHERPFPELEGIVTLFGYLVDQINVDASRQSGVPVEKVRWSKSFITKDQMICWLLSENNHFLGIFMNGSRPFAGTITPVEEFSLDSSIQIIHEFNPKIVAEPTRRNRIHALQ